MKKYFEEINIARGIGIILVVLGHAFPDSSSGMSNNFAKVIYNTIYSFHMPLFIFIAGFVATKVLDLRVDIQGGNYIKQRVNRLLIPYLVVGLLYLPFKVAMSKFSNVPYDVRELWKIFFGKNPNFAMWTLWVLFVLAIVAVYVVNRKNIVRVTVFSLMIANIYFAIDCNVDLLGVDQVISNAGYYFLGIFVAIKYEMFKRFVLEKKISVGLFATTFIGINILGQIMKYNGMEQQEMLKMFTGISGIILTIFISTKVIELKDNNVIKEVLNIIGRYSMDIYIISTFVQPCVRIMLWTKMGMNYVVYTMVSTVGGVVVSMLISKYIVRKIGVLRRLILGMK